MSTTATDIGTLITQTPGICGGRPCIAHKGVSVRRIVLAYKAGETPEEMVTQRPQLALAEVHAALAYYHANREAIDADLAREQAEYDRLAAAHPAERNAQ